MMADVFVDPALFRMRTFEVEWVEPLKAELSKLLDRSVDTTQTRAKSDGTVLLLHVLITEADRWLAIGQQVGYFAQASPSAYPSSLAEAPELKLFLNAISSQTELPPGLGVREFARALSEARDDLTTERREFLRLVCFAEEAEWIERLNRIRALAQRLTDRPEELPPPEMVDEVTWGLDDFRWDIDTDPIHPPREPGRAVSETSTSIELQRHLPAKWRLGAFALIAEKSPVVGWRLAALAEARASIAATIRGLINIQHTTHTITRATPRAHSELRNLVVVVESEPDVDPYEVERLVRQLRAELKELDVESVVSATLENAPAGTKGVDPISLGTLLITLSAAGGVFTALIDTARDWLARHAAARHISVTIDGDTIVLEKGSAQERRALIETYMRRHEVE